MPISSVLVGDESKSWVSVSFWDRHAQWVEHVQVGDVVILLGMQPRSWRNRLSLSSRWQSQLWRARSSAPSASAPTHPTADVDSADCAVGLAHSHTRTHTHTHTAPSIASHSAPVRGVGVSAAHTHSSASACDWRVKAASLVEWAVERHTVVVTGAAAGWSAQRLKTKAFPATVRAHTGVATCIAGGAPGVLLYTALHALVPGRVVHVRARVLDLSLASARVHPPSGSGSGVAASVSVSVSGDPLVSVMTLAESPDVCVKLALRWVVLALPFVCSKKTHYERGTEHAQQTLERRQPTYICICMGWGTVSHLSMQTNVCSVHSPAALSSASDLQMDVGSWCGIFVDLRFVQAMISPHSGLLELWCVIFGHSFGRSCGLLPSSMQLCGGVVFVRHVTTCSFAFLARIACVCVPHVSSTPATEVRALSASHPSAVEIR